MARVKSKKYAGVYLNHLSNGDISYAVSYKDAHNKKVWVTIGKKSNGITEKFAYAKRAEYINKVKNGVDPLAHKKKKNIVTLNALAKTYFDNKRCHTCEHCKAYNQLDPQIQADVPLTDKSLNCDHRTKKHLLNKYNKHLAPIFGKKDVSQIKKEDVNKFIQKLQSQGKAANTINGIVQLMGAIINYSIKNKELPIINPCVGIGKLATDNDRQRYLSTDEVKTLLDALKDDPRTLLFVRLSLSTGGRLQTILNIRKIDLDLQNSTVTLKDFKNNDTYKGFLDDALTRDLEILVKNLNPNDYIVGGKPTRLSTNALSSKLRPVLNRLFNAGVDEKDTKNRVVIHTLRHTFASHLAINGTPIFTIQKLMNHRDITMTMRYAKLAPDQGMEAVKGLYK